MTIEQIKRAHASAEPKASNPAWQHCHRDCGVLLAEIERLRERERVLVEALDKAQEWFAVHSRHSPTCGKYAIVPDGKYVSGLVKDYGGRYPTEEEFEAATCTCGWEEAHRSMCEARAALGREEG